MSIEILPIYIKVDENFLVINMENGTNYKGKLVIKNVFSENIVFKIFSNKQKTYNFLKNYGLLEPNENCEIVVLRRNLLVKLFKTKELDENELKEEKLMIKAFKVNSNIMTVQIF